MEANIEITARELIKPSSPTPHERKDHKLSFIDQLAVPFFIPMIFFYEKQPYSENDDRSKTAQLLKQSLSQSLAKFYPLAGKLNGDLSIDCDDSGALFVEAKIHASLSQAIQNVPLEKLYRFLPSEPFAIGSTDELLDTCPVNDILFAVQISWFECGGIAIGIRISHKVGDLMSLVTFMNSWAAMSRSSVSTNPLVLKEPNFDLGRHLFPPPEFHLISNFGQLAGGKEAIMFKRFLFEEDKLAELKQLAISSSLVKHPTRVEVITAFLCKQFIKVERAKNQAAARTMFTVMHAVNLRSRMSSLALSGDGFPFGNLSIVTSASITCDEDEEEKDYGDLVWDLSSSLRKVNDYYVVNSVIPFLHSLGSANGIELLQQKTMINDWFFTSWCRFPIYEVDFGWGKPLSVTPGGIGTSGGVLLMDTRCGNGVEAWVAIKEDEMALLSEEFLALQNNDILPANP